MTLIAPNKKEGGLFVGRLDAWKAAEAEKAAEAKTTRVRKRNQHFTSFINRIRQR